MAKRCSAQKCFNSTLYTKNVSYFSFPKHKVFADQWADLAGRSDLKQKSLSQMTKYFLCSEHFTANCFNDKEKRQKLKRDLPHSIAFPSIFQNNLQETMQVSNPGQSIEVHNIILLEGDTRKKQVKYESTSESQESASDGEKQLKKRLVSEIEVLEDIEILGTSICPNNQEQEKVVDIINNSASDLKRCRLCLKELKSDEPTIQLKDSLHLQEFIVRVMSDKITVDDEYSQVVCKNCENNSLLCLIIIKQMDTTQEKIVSSSIDCLVTA